MPGYVDLHLHILPAIDDGPRTMAQSLDLARDLVAAGYRQAAATPHAMEGRPTPATILERLDLLRAALTEAQIPLELLPGAENHIDPHLPRRLQEGQVLTLNKSTCLLLELPMLQPLPLYTFKVIEELSAAGYRAVIPHPERVRDLCRHPDLLFRLHRAGALFQLTWAALLGYLGRQALETAHLMIKANLAHFFATDAHASGSRLLQVAPAAARLEDLPGAPLPAELLSKRPAALLAGASPLLPPVRLAEPPRVRRLFGLLPARRS